MTTTVAFHTGVEDKLAHACRLLRKAYRQGAKVVVAGPAPLLQKLDHALWTFEPQDFIPHVRLGPGTKAQEVHLRTPVWLVEPGAEPPHHEVLVNFGPERLVGDEAYQRIIEIVSREADDVAAARRRWKQYEAHGLPITHHPQGAAA